MSNDPFSVLRLKEFRLYVAARLFITIALQIEAVIIGWQIFKITNDTLSLGLIGLSEAVPSILVALYAGHFADITNRKRIIQITVLILLFCSLSLAFLAMDKNADLLQRTTIPLYLVIFISGLARGFFNPANFAFMPQLVERKDYARAISWSSTAWQTGAVAGPAISGLIYAIGGFRNTYIVVAILVGVALLLYTLIPSKPLPAYNPDLTMKAKITEGLRFVFSNQVILGAITLDLFAVLFGGAVALLPAFAKDILFVGAEGLGFLRAAPAVGAIIMAIYLAYRPMQRDAGKKLLWSVAGFGICMIAFGISNNFYLSIALLVLSGIFDSVSVIIRSTLIHTLTPENMKGRVSAVNSIFIGSSNEIGAFESGVTARIMGTGTSVIFGGCMTLFVVSITAGTAKQLRRLHLTTKEKGS